MMLKRSAVEQKEQEWLAPFAVKSDASRGRKYPEKEHEFRTVFQRDRDRILYCNAFRRLEYKTQVFVNHEGDHYRTRLTHTLEMSLIARTVGRALRLNEDLIEAIALAHDLGHGPFGHAGQAALAELMQKYGGFEHNRQALRIVEELEESYAGFPGLNLSFEVLEGLKKHEKKRTRSLEAEVVDLADAIAYNCHDLDDGLRAGLLNKTEALEISIWRDVNRYAKAHAKNASETVLCKMGVRLLMNRLVGDTINETLKNLERFGIGTLPDLQKAKTPVVRFSPAVEKDFKELRNFLRDRLYQHHRVIRMTSKGQRFIQELFRVYEATPRQMPPEILERAKKDGLQRVICDYIAGMTDRFALDEYNRLFSPYERV